MIRAIFLPLAAVGALCAVPGLGLAATDRKPPMVVAGVMRGVCEAQLAKCTSRCRGSAVCTSRCAANDHACRVGGKPVFR
jgi:hypothetical protein